MKTRSILGAVCVVMMACTYVQAQQVGIATIPVAKPPVFDYYGVVQVGASIKDTGPLTTGYQKAVLGAELGQDLGHHVVFYLNGGWNQYWNAVHGTGGVKYEIPVPTGSLAHPYVRGGLGAIHVLRQGEDPAVFMGEAGGGVALDVGRQGYIDIGYRRMFFPIDISNYGLDGAWRLGLGGIYVGFGFRY